MAKDSLVGPSVNKKRLRLALVDRGKRLVDIHRSTGIPYNRLVRIANGYCTASPAEIVAMARALDLAPSDLTESRMDAPAWPA
jgi:hypothetical protein